MQNYVILCIFVCLLDHTASQELILTNATWNKELKLECSPVQSLIYIKEALFGSLVEKDGRKCVVPVSKHLRNFCNRKNKCKLHVILGPFFNPKDVNCTSSPGLYVKHICINSGSSIVDLTNVATQWSGYVKPAEKESGGFQSAQVKWEKINRLCKIFPRYVRFELLDINLFGNCQQGQLSVELKQGAKTEKMGPFCEKDLDEVPEKLRIRSFINVTSVTFNFTTTNRITSDHRGFLLKFAGMQCSPLPQPPNTVVEVKPKQHTTIANIRCRHGFEPRPRTPKEVIVECVGNECAEDCDPEMCVSQFFKWTKYRSSDSVKAMHCVHPSALTTTVSTTTLSTTSTSTTAAPTTSVGNSSSKIPVKVTSRPIPVENTSTPSKILPPDYANRGTKNDDPQVIAGIIGGAVGIIACLIVGILILMVCRKTRCANCPGCCCIDSLIYSKASYANSQAASQAGTTFGTTFSDSTLALRYRPPSTISTHVGNTTLASVNRSSVGSSILFASSRRSKRKTIPHPSTLGCSGPYDETVPLFPDQSQREVSVFSPSVETYLEPDRRPSVSSRPSEPAPLPPSAPPIDSGQASATPRGVYQVYDETRSSRNALDRFDGPQPPPADPRQSMALISNHYYCRGGGSDNDKDSCDSVYEDVGEAHSSVSSTPCETRRHFPVANRNDYVQPPELPARPNTMSRSHQELPDAPLEPFDDGEEDGYQPVNCANRVNV